VVSEAGALLELLHELKRRHYLFICVTPATHARVLARPLVGEPTLRDIFGWNRTFTEAQLEPRLLDLLRGACRLDQSGGQFRSRVRVATLGGHLFLHSSYPTDSSDAVFFGPDTYRFARFVLAHLPGLGASREIIEMGAGSGAVGILVAQRVRSARVTLVDINPAAIMLSGINGQAAGVEVECALSDCIPGGSDLVIANPPYMMDPHGRAYRDGGALFGGEIACEWVREALRALSPGGTMLLYTGAAVVDGRMPLVDSIEESCRRARASMAWEDIEADVFGEELDEPAYREVERIAVVGIRIERTAGKPA
jgi:methylase of polypeptide subunit release factors